MNELFSFETNLIKAKSNDSIKILSKYTYQKSVTVKIESNISKLSGFYVIKPNSNLILEFTLTENTTLKAVKVWGAIWDLNGYLDCNINIFDEIPNKYENIKKDVHKLPNYYKKHKKLKQAFLKQHYTFKKSNDNIYYIDVLSDIHNFKISNNATYELLQKNNKSILVDFEKLKKLEVVLSITLDHKTYMLPGQEIQSTIDLSHLIDQIINIFEQHNIQNIDLTYEENKIRVIEKRNISYTRIKFNGPLESLSYNFVKNKNITNKLKVYYKPTKLNEYSRITIQAIEKCDNSICIINIINDIKLEFNIDYYIDDKHCYITLTTNNILNHDVEWVLTTEDRSFFSAKTLKKHKTKLLWIFDISKYEKDFNIICSNINNTVLTKRISVNKTYNKSIYYSIKHNKTTTTLKIFSNKPLLNSQEFNVNILNNSISKHNVDFKIKQTNFKITKNKKYKELKIKWLTNKSVRDIKLKIGDTIIPIKHVNKEYYPNNITFNNTSNDYKHVLNKIVNKELTLKYTDGTNDGELIIQPNTRYFTYYPTSNNVSWKVYDNDILLFEQELFYSKVVNEIAVIYKNLVKHHTKSYIELKTTHIFNSDIKFKIISESNININISGEYIIKSTEENIKIPIISNRNASVGWLVFRVYSLTDNIIINNKKHIIMFN